MAVFCEIAEVLHACLVTLFEFGEVNLSLALEVVEVFYLFIEVLLVGKGLYLVLDVANRDLKLHFADLHTGPISFMKETYRLAIHLRDHAVLVELSLFLKDGFRVDRLCGQAVESLDFGRNGPC